MGYPTYPFVTPDNNDFINLNNAPQIILETTSNTIRVDSINIVNTTDSDIRINIKRQTNIDTPIEGFLVYNFLIPSFRTVDAAKKYYNTIELVKELGLNITLLYSSSLDQKLICYSNGSNQYFDCAVDYTIFNEIPPSS